MKENEMADYETAGQAIVEAAQKLAENAENFNGPTQAQMVLSAAYAYRAVKGGAQPGTSVLPN